MQLSYNAPASLWDEFCTTSAYLTNFTASSSLNGKTPYEFWFDRKPSLSHLHKVGCRAFALIQTHNPKIFQRSILCVLIGYAPHAKAYRLWDTSTGRIFNSYHITFIEHLQAQRADLLLGTTIKLNPDAPPSWNSMPVLSSAPAPDVPDPDDKDDELIPDPILPSFPPLIPSNPTILPPLSYQITSHRTTTVTNTIPSITTMSQRITAPTNTIPSSTNNNNTTNPTILPTITIMPPQNENNNNNVIIPAIPPPLRRSPHLLACHNTNAKDLHSAFLSEFAPLCNSHTLLPLYFTHSDFPSTNILLSSISDGSAKPVFDTDDDPSWAKAICSLEREYWITGAHEELRSLADMQVFVLVPRSDIPQNR